MLYIIYIYIALAWAPMLMGPPGNCPACPCLKTELNKVVTLICFLLLIFQQLVLIENVITKLIMSASVISHARPRTTVALTRRCIVETITDIVINTN